MEEVEDVNMASRRDPRRWQWDESLELKMSMERLRAMEEVEDVNMASRLYPRRWQWDESLEWKRRPLKVSLVCPDICDPAEAAACAYGYDEAALRFSGSGPKAAWPTIGDIMSAARKSRSKKTPELRRIGCHGMDGTELGEAKGKWSGIWRQPNDAEIRAAVRHFRPMLRSFTNDDDGVQPTTLSDRRFRNYCFTLLSKLVGDTIRGSAVSVLEHGGITDIEDGLRYFVRGPNVYQHLRGEASSSRTTDTASTLMGDGRRHDQDPRMKEFRNYAYWITSLSITILVGLLSANKRQPDLLFRSCSSLASGASICGIAMLMLVLIRPSSQRALTCLKMMQYLTIGLLFVAAVLVFTLL